MPLLNQQGPNRFEQSIQVDLHCRGGGFGISQPQSIGDRGMFHENGLEMHGNRECEASNAIELTFCAVYDLPYSERRPMLAIHTVKGFIELVESVVVEFGRQALLLVHVEVEPALERR